MTYLASTNYTEYLTLTDDYQIRGLDSRILFMNPNGADRNVYLPARGEADQVFHLINDSDGTNNINIREFGGTTTLIQLNSSRYSVKVSFQDADITFFD